MRGEGHRRKAGAGKGITGICGVPARVTRLQGHPSIVKTLRFETENSVVVSSLLLRMDVGWCVLPQKVGRTGQLKDPVPNSLFRFFFFAPIILLLAECALHCQCPWNPGYQSRCFLLGEMRTYRCARPAPVAIVGRNPVQKRLDTAHHLR